MEKWPNSSIYCSGVNFFHKAQNSLKFFTNENEKTSKKSKQDVILKTFILEGGKETPAGLSVSLAPYWALEGISFNLPGDPGV